MANTAQINIKVDSKQADNSVNKLNTELEGTVKQTTSLKAQLRAMQNELNTLDEGSARFRELSIEAGKLRDQIKDTQDVINSTAGTSVENLGTALNGVASIGIAGFQAVTAAQALFGTESEELQKQLLKVQAIAGLADAVKTLGGLGDTMTQIKASAIAAAQSMGILTTATEAEAVATEGATVAQEGLNTAMKLNPVGAILAGIIALTTAVIAFTGQSKELTKEEKKRKAELDAINKAQQESIKTIADESTEFVGLIYQLKETNAGSKQRRDLIKEINKEYGTTIKNLSDETEFQRLLNKEVADYIQYQTVKLQIQKNEAAFNLILERKLLLQQKITAAETEAERVSKSLGITVGDYYRNNSEVVKSLEQWRAQLSGAEFKLKQYTGRILTLKDSEDKLTNSGKKYVEQTKETTKTNDDNVKSIDQSNSAYIEYLKTLQSVEDEIQNVIDAERKSIQFQFKGMTVGFANTPEELKKQEAALIDYMNGRYRYISENLLKVQKEIDDVYKNLQESESNLLNEELTNLTNLLEAKVITQKEFSDKVAEIEKQHNERVDQNHTEYLKLYRLKTEEAKNDEIRLNDVTYNEIQKIRQQAIVDTYEYQKQQTLKEIDESELSETQKEEAKRRVRLAYAKKEEEELKKLLDIQKQLRKKQFTKDTLDHNTNLVEKEKLSAQYQADILKMEQDTQNQIDALYDDTTVSLKDSLVARASEYQQYVDTISQVFSSFSSAYQALEDSIIQKRLAQIKTVYDAEIEANEAALANKSITEEEYNKRKKEADDKLKQEERALRRKQFNDNKRLSLAQATIDGISASLSAFAQTPGGIVVKSIAAGLAAVFSAMQIAAIENTEFTAAKGGIVPQNGKPSNVDSVPSMLAPGETVINSGSSGLFPELLNLINMAGGGDSLLPQVSFGNTNKPQPVYSENRQSQTIRAYVVEQDITSSQQRIKRIQNTTTF